MQGRNLAVTANKQPALPVGLFVLSSTTSKQGGVRSGRTGRQLSTEAELGSHCNLLSPAVVGTAVPLFRAAPSMRHSGQLTASVPQ
jgi:hypothetical protein